MTRRIDALVLLAGVVGTVAIVVPACGSDDEPLKKLHSTTTSVATTTGPTSGSSSSGGEPVCKPDAGSDVDCGGTCPDKCTLGKKCTKGADCTSGECDTTKKACVCPAEMVLVNAAYCIDVTEVSKGEYNTFLGTAPKLTEQRAECVDSNMNFTPSVWPPEVEDLVYPVTNVDWCDAYKYCDSMNKHLCGKIGGTADGNPFGDFEKESASEWFNVCSVTMNHYPYGDTYDATKCIGADTPVPDGGMAGPIAVVDPMNKPMTSKCNGGVLGVYHMSGNVREWENSCEGTAGAADPCHTRGGSFKSSEMDLMCGAPAAEPRNAQLADLGFRCCFGP